ncbi:hypothetical protein [Bdellovibrio sp. HCB274]|uniref:hypothetical protein n=1 Tax=Bdellovibrio sp. HCB274 TaxID=3394361 RepID=UPI0039B4151D
MKKSALFAIVVLALSNVTFAQSKSCFRAKQGEATIKSLDTNKSEIALSLVATLEDSSIDSNGDLIPERLTLNAKSETMQFSTVAVHFPELGEGTFIVECDGGTAQLSETVNGYDINSRSLQGSIGGDSDCGTSEAVIVLKNVNLESTVCAE